MCFCDSNKNKIFGGDFMNDYELGAIRRETQLKYGVQKGFPIHLVTIIEGGEIRHKCFFTFKAMREFVEEREFENYIYNLVYANDIKEVKYEV